MEEGKKPEEPVAVTIEDAELEASISDKATNTGFFIGIGLIILVLLGIVFGLRGFNPGQPTAAATLSIDDLHRMNLQGDLPPEVGYVFKGLSFVKDDLWYTNYERDGTTFILPFHFDPKAVRDIEVIGNLDGLKENELFHIAFNPVTTNGFVTVASGEVTKILAGVEFKNMIPSCTLNETDACSTRPIASCDEPQSKPVIEIRNEGEPMVQVLRNCILVSGQGEELIKAAERLIYEWLDIL